MALQGRQPEAELAGNQAMPRLLEILGLKPLRGIQGAGAPAASTAADAMADWKARRAAAQASLKAVAGRIAAAKHLSSPKAIIELQAVAKNLSSEPSTPQQIAELQRYLGEDDVVAEVCELAEDIRTPLLSALDRILAQLGA